MKKLLATTILAVTILTGCGQVSPYSPPPAEVPDAKTVMVVGDSITAFSQLELDDQLYDFRHSVNGVPGINIQDAKLALVIPALLTRPDMMVVELGINSARDGWDESDVAALDSTLSYVSGVPCVVWPTLTAQAPGYFDHLGPGTLRDRISTFKEALAALAVTRPNVHVVDWSAVEDLHPEYIRADGLHMTEAGRLAYAAFIDGSLKRFCDYA